jgi:hypothetical protein
MTGVGFGMAAHQGSAGVPPAVAGASRSRARAEPVLSAAKECPRPRGRDARATILKAVAHLRRLTGAQER